MNKVPPVRFLSIASSLLVFSISACGSGSSGTAPPLGDQDGAPFEAGVIDDAGGDGAPGAMGSDDSGPLTAIDTGTGGMEEDASTDAASDDGGLDAASCGAPSGTYSSSCTDCTVAGGMLTCSCTTNSNSTATTSLDLCTCPDTTTISNANGVLTCCGNPGGTYTSTCDECETNATILGCTCKTDNGGFISSFLPLCKCQAPAQISNTDGILTCQR
jgi:CVNH domain-containing protein